MIELPEALTIAQQMGVALGGKRIVDVVRGNSPHKFAFYSGTEEEYREILVSETLGEAWAHGSSILQAVGDEHVIILGEGGERILYHSSARTLPKKHQLLLRFDDDTLLTVTISGWGAARAMSRSDVSELPYMHLDRVSPLSDAFTLDHFHGLFTGLDEGYNKAVKCFVISEPGVLGVGNGYLQDILFRARIHPRRKVADIAREEQRALYHAIRATLQDAVGRSGRDTERDLYGQKGAYVRTMDSRTLGQPCPVCGTPIAKQAFLGGACYFCPQCQT